MELSKAIQILEQHNKWRRDRNDIKSIPMVNATQLGISIDTVVNEFKNRK